MSQKRHQKNLKRKKNKAKGEQHYMLREFRRMAQYMYAQTLNSERKKEETDENTPNSASN